MLKLPSLFWFNFIELDVSVKDLKVSCNRILGKTTVSLLFLEFDFLTLPLIVSIFFSNR